MKVSSVILSLAVVALALDYHPTLPTMWVSETNDPPMGDGLESYYFIDKPTADQPSAMWSNYTTPECRRLIWSVGVSQTRYLLKCDAVDCCKEEGSGNQVEFQIPNVHPAVLAKNFTHTPNVTLLNTYGTTLTGLDMWHWEFGPEKWDVYTSACASCVNKVRLHRWYVQAFTEQVAIDFVNFTGIPESGRTEFKSGFYVPDQCKPDNVLRCDDKTHQPRAVSRVADFHKKVLEKYGDRGNLYGKKHASLKLVNSTNDCCLDGDCCHGVEYCCDTCDGSCRCSVNGKCH